MNGDGPEEYRVSVDFIACNGHGICAYLLPSNLGLDEWGYPIVRKETVGTRELRSAKRAALMCPELAIKIEPIPAQAQAAKR